MFDAKQGGDVAVSLCLRHDAVSRVNEYDGKVAGRRARGHVTGVLLVSRRVGNDELSLCG